MLQSVGSAANIGAVDNIERGDRIKKRRMYHGFASVREFASEVGISRAAVTRAEKGEASVGTYLRLEKFLDDFEHEVGEDLPTPAVAVTEPSGDQPFIRISVDIPGVRALVLESLPENKQELADTVARIIQQLQQDSD